jgi:hypothetical protein
MNSPTRAAVGKGSNALMSGHDPDRISFTSTLRVKRRTTASQAPHDTQVAASGARMPCRFGSGSVGRLVI